VSEQTKRAGGWIVSYRFAAGVIGVLLGASAAGWIATELVPPDFPKKTALYEKAWGAGVAKLVAFFRLYDPFHSFWYELALALFFVVLLVCVVSRWRQLALKSLRPNLPAGASELRGRALSFDVRWGSRGGGGRKNADSPPNGGGTPRAEASTGVERSRAPVSKLFTMLSSRGYHVSSSEQDGVIRFAASTGRWRSPGTMLFHVAILVVTVGGIIGSFMGWREMTFVPEGGSVPFPRDSMLSLRVTDFDIVMTRRGEIRDFISTVLVLNASGDVIASGKVEVNRPMRVGGRRIYQSEFTTDENGFKDAHIDYTVRGGTHKDSVDVTPGQTVSIGNGAITLTPIKFLPDFRMSPRGPFSASAYPANPALEVEVATPRGVETGWLFVNHPDFNARFNAPVDLVLARCEPLYYTGLEVNSNPGAPVLLAGFALATIGLLLMYLCNPRVLKGIADAESIVMAGCESRWKATFEKEFGDIRETVRWLAEHGGERHDRSDR
jgi:cytochrome c biogenesis protein